MNDTKDIFGRHACPYCLTYQEMEKEPSETHRTRCALCGGEFLTLPVVSRTLQRRGADVPARGGEW